MIDISHISDVHVPTPINEISEPILNKYGVRLLIKRDDLIHTYVTGNKWRKLVGNLKMVLANGKEGIITFGGAFSNHIYAAAAAAHLVNISSVGIIRGEYDRSNPTLIFAKEKGMKLHFVDRTSYKKKENSDTVKEVLSRYPHHFLIPEGGSNELAMVGLKELAEELNNLTYDVLTVAAGTGATAIGLINYQQKKVEVYTVLKADHLKNEIEEHVGYRSFDYINDCHLGGYGKTNDEYISWINRFYNTHKIALDPIYNGKVIYGLYNRIQKGFYPKGTTILHVHTGGLQGVSAYNYLATKNNKTLLTIE